MATKKTKKKAEPEEPAGAPKVFDVAKPGKTAADPTARPIIVGHGSMIKQDPMVVDTDGSESKASTPPSTEGVKIVPISDGSDDDKKEKVAVEPPAEEEKTPEEAEPKAEEATEPPAEEPKSEEPEVPEEPPKEEPQSSAEEQPKQQAEENAPDAAAAATDTLASKAATQKEDQKKLEEEAKKAEELNKLVESKKYYVKVHQGPAGHSYASWLFFILLFTSIGVVLAIDAGLLNVGIALPFDLIKN